MFFAAERSSRRRQRLKASTCLFQIGTQVELYEIHRAHHESEGPAPTLEADYNQSNEPMRLAERQDPSEFLR